MPNEIINFIAAAGAIGAAIASIGAAVVSYFLLRRTTDPDVLVYTEQDPVEPRFLYIVIENMGQGVAYNVDFKLSSKRQHEIVWFAKDLTGALTRAFQPYRLAEKGGTFGAMLTW